MICGCFQVFIHSALKRHLGYAWWCPHLIPDPGRQGQEEYLWVWGKTVLHNKFQAEPWFKQITYGHWWDRSKSKGVDSVSRPELYPWDPRVRRNITSAFVVQPSHAHDVDHPLLHLTHMKFTYSCFIYVLFHWETPAQKCADHSPVASVKKVPSQPVEN